MEQTTSDGMCRCCASEGSFKDFQTTYHWMGVEEIYSDMLKNCFNISLSTSEVINNGGICEVCVTQLRNAYNFKRQVQLTEEQFKKRVRESVFKSSTIKLEMQQDDVESDNIASDNLSDADYEVPIKEEKLEDKPKKRQAKASTSKAKKQKTEGETSKRHKLITVNEDKVNESLENMQASKENIKTRIDAKDVNKIICRKEVIKHRKNIIEVVLNSNATPIRCKNDLGYSCMFCTDHYPNPADLKKHTLMNHDEEAVIKVVKDIRMYTVKLDITDLQCIVCESDIENIDDLIEHLISVHGRTLHLDIKNHMVPFKFKDEELKCAVCSTIFTKFRNLTEHMNIHYRNYVCDVCGAGFVNRDILRSHLKIHIMGTFNCDFCPKSFNTKVKKKSHITTVHKKVFMTRKCGYCNELFDDYNKKNCHLAKFHGVNIAAVKCNLCDKPFSNPAGVRRHIKKDHLLERKHECDVCMKKFFGKSDLSKHMISHTGQRNFTCNICGKNFGLKFTLVQHMRVHSKDSQIMLG